MLIHHASTVLGIGGQYNGCLHLFPSMQLRLDELFRGAYNLAKMKMNTCTALLLGCIY